MVGVYDPGLTEPIAHVLGRLGVREAYVVHGLERLDEISISGETQVSHLKDGEVTTFRLRPEDAGLSRRRRRPSGAATRRKMPRSCEASFKGQRGPKRDVVLLNAAAALVVAGRAQNLREGVAVAAEAIDDGRAYAKLQALIEFTRSQAA